MDLDSLVQKIEEYFLWQRIALGQTFFVEKNPEKELGEIPEPIAEARPVAAPAVQNLSESKPEEIVIEPVPESTIGTNREMEKIMEINEQRSIIPTEIWNKAETLEQLKGLICDCHNCQLGDTRRNFVFGTGNPDADLVVIGEAPGADEDEQGAPFVGRAGQLLTKILESVNFSREEVFICNIIKCRPPGNRRPLVPEVDACEPYLKKQIELIKPKFILALGLTAVDTLLKKKHAMASTRGQLMDYHGIQMLVTYHPAALLRNPEWKRSVWEDVKMLRKLYDEYQQSKQ